MNITNVLLVVMYKTSLSDSVTVQSIINYIRPQSSEKVSGYRLVIWDNSPSADIADLERLYSLLPALDVRYVRTPENCPLSKIYNKVVSGLVETEYLTLLDQDSILLEDYFMELRKAQVEGHPLILPQVMCGGILVSPGERFFCKGKLLRGVTPGRISSKNLLAINSGISAMGEVFKMIPYDDRLKFYGTDTYFMKQYEKHFPYAYVLNAKLEHSLAENDISTSVERKQQIAQARQEAWAIVFTETLAERIFLYAYQRALQFSRWLKKVS